MKNKITLILLFCFLQNISAQIIIEPMIGFKALVLRDINYGGSHSCEKNQFKESFRLKHLTYGLGLGIQLNSNFSLNLNANFSNRTETYCDRGVVGWTNLKFRKYQFTLLPKYQTANFIFGVGANLNVLEKLQLGKEDIDIWTSLDQRYDGQQLGWIATAGYSFKPILFELRYSDSRTFGDDSFQFTPRIQAVELVLSYRFKIKNTFGQGKSKNKCPKF